MALKLQLDLESKEQHRTALLLKMQMEQLERLGGANIELNAVQGSRNLGMSAGPSFVAYIADPLFVRKVLMITGGLTVFGLWAYLGISNPSQVLGPRKSASHIV
eukprot:FR738800.1.p2 GENE.FR738800.1~~FR738800.1.p2  ORF type:complete len:104 (+),score=12.66 FR738800.1:356-667(+)